MHVLCVCPGFTRTEFQSHVDVDLSQIPSFAWMTAEEVVSQAVAEVGRRPVLVNGRLNAEKAKKINSTYLFDIGGDGGGKWFADLTKADGPWIEKKDAEAKSD